MDANQLKINSVNVSTTQTFDNSMRAQPVRVVTFYVDRHGPFELRYAPPAEATPERVRADMDKQVADLRALVGGL